MSVSDFLCTLPDIGHQSPAQPDAATATIRIGLAYAPGSSYWRHVIEGIRDYARDHANFHYVFRSRLSSAIAQAAAVDVAGYIASAPESLPDGVPDHLPRVYLTQTASPHIRPAQRVCGRVACEHLLDCGINSFAAIRADIVTERQRIEGFVNCAADNGIDTAMFDLSLPASRYGPHLVDQTESLVQFLKTQPKPLGLVTGDSVEAEWAMYACEISGIRVPDDIAIISTVDDDLILGNLQPSVSGVMLDQRQAGYQAARLIHLVIEGDQAIDDVAVPPFGVIERESTQLLKVEDKWVEQVVVYIWDHVADGVSVEKLADVFATSERTLLRRFKAAMGRGPRQEIRRSRVQTAIRLLTSTHMRLTDVAAAAGFSSQSLMGRYIKADTGQTAVQLRQDRRIA